MTAARKPTHHPACHYLVRYAAGTLSGAMRLFMASHLALCPSCRQELQTYEAQAGLALENLPPEALDASCLDNLLSRIDENGPPACIDVTVPPPAAPDPRYPEPLHAHSGARGERISWQGGPSAARRGRLAQAPASIIIVEARDPVALRAILEPAAPPHTLVLVLGGLLQKGHAAYRAGDVARLAQLRGATVADGEPLLALAVTPEKADQPGFFDRLLFMLSGDGF